MSDTQAPPAGWRKAVKVVRRFLWWIGVIAILGAIMVMLVARAVHQSGYRPLPQESETVELAPWAGASSAPKAVEQVRVLTISLNFAAGSAPLDFESGATRPLTAEEVTPRLDRLAALAQDERADVLVLREVDFGSRFAGELDQAEYVARQLRFGYIGRCRMWRHPHLPYPHPLPGRMVGPVDLGMAVISRIPFIESRRIALAPVRGDDWWQTTFAPNFALQEVQLLLGERSLLLHNAALSRLDPVAREQQARQVAEHVAAVGGGAALLLATLHDSPLAGRLSPGGGRGRYTHELIRHKLNFQQLFTNQEAEAHPERFASLATPEGPRFSDFLLPERHLKVVSWSLLPALPDLSPGRPLLIEVIP